MTNSILVEFHTRNRYSIPQNGVLSVIWGPALGWQSSPSDSKCISAEICVHRCPFISASTNLAHIGGRTASRCVEREILPRPWTPAAAAAAHGPGPGTRGPALWASALPQPHAFQLSLATLLFGDAILGCAGRCHPEITLVCTATTRQFRSESVQVPYASLRSRPS